MIIASGLERKPAHAEQGNQSSCAAFRVHAHANGPTLHEITGDALLLPFRWSRKQRLQVSSVFISRLYLSSILFSNLLFAVKDVHFTAILMKSDLCIPIWSQNGLPNLTVPSATHAEIPTKPTIFIIRQNSSSDIQQCHEKSSDIINLF